MNYTLILEFIILGFCLVGSAFFSASETALMAMSKLRIKKVIEKEGDKFKVLNKWLKHSDRILITLLIGNNLVNICAASLSTLIVSNFVGHNFIGRIASITTGILTFIILILGEITPKTFAKQNAEKLAPLIINFLDKLSGSILPLINLFKFISTILIRILGGKVENPDTMITEDEIATLVDVGEKEGVLEEDECDMIHGVMEFGDTDVRRVMLPRVDMKLLEPDIKVKDVIKTAVEYGHSRIPVYEEKIDNIIGILYVKDIMKYIGSESFETLKVRDILRKPFFIPETKKLDDVLKEFQKERVHIAIVVDEYGGTAGLVTIEDLLEEIVGDILDEYDKEEVELIRKINDNAAIVNAKMSVSELNEEFNLDIPDEEAYDSLGGFITSIAEDLPKRGDIIKYKNLELKILDADEKRLLKVKIEKKETINDDKRNTQNDSQNKE